MSVLALILNCGSSSVKFALINQYHQTLCSGVAQALGQAQAQMSWQIAQEKFSQTLPVDAMHGEVIQRLVSLLKDAKYSEQITVIGHRIVHGGEKFANSVLIDHNVLAAIKAVSPLAPLHNPANLLGIELANHYFPRLPQVAVFDTAFHQTLPAQAYLYALPYELYQQHGIRRYGFHGTSHKYVATQAAKMLNKPLTETQLITAHLGNGCSITAIKQGLSVDTSMGFTPLAGFCMGTRSGDLDPGLINHLITQLNYSPELLNKLLNNESGLKGLSQLSNDCRLLEEAIHSGSRQAALALDIFAYQIAKTIASYAAALSKINAIVFTGGIGENSALIREKVISHLSVFGLILSECFNLAARFGKAGVISCNAGTQVLVIPTNEELAIAQDAFQLTSNILVGGL